MSTEKWVIGTGFSRGIGFELAKIIKDNNYKIIHLGRGQCGFEDHFIWWDLLNPITDSPILELSKNLYGKQIAGFIYAAGVMPILSVSESNRTEKHLFWQSQAESLRINYLSCAEIIEDILPFIMSKNDTDSQITPFVAHLSSLAAIDPFPGLELYGGSKAACLFYFKWLSKRFAMDELTCLSVHPGTVNTDMVNNILQNSSNDLSIVKLYQKMKQNNEFIEPAKAAEKIYKFLFNDSELRNNSHGKLFLADKGSIFEQK
ncbi:SDR family NAD(P)-dependent oxidoreductase [Pigmentibacter sp. JX0631]|uniref:SDR family NAD(P)-dependent oxidoreductase n=1 Tax=Pigmentibacter sp. JX0631 TaxID=2976982 RepID=UPI00246823A9|nr:SDR family NAD(P)-dependent oxidoreductase [Pigmentibacter sp. JX0631]WGL60947.1 SDR family NAD(P)-dependent oxidoreductase [Pigmentibacter sp. JX0631]